jgi:uncharacterized protein YndB with AHSA1/START domain
VPPLYFVEREFPYPVERLWRAWTNSQELENWYCPTYLSVIPGSTTSDPVPGGTWAIGVDVSANGFNAYFWGTYRQVIKHQKLVQDLNYSQDELEFDLREPSEAPHRIEIVFTKLGDCCLVRFSQFGEMGSDQAEASKEGIESYFDNLEAFLNSRPS